MIIEIYPRQGIQIGKLVRRTFLCANFNVDYIFTPVESNFMCTISSAGVLHITS